MARTLKDVEQAGINDIPLEEREKSVAKRELYYLTGNVEDALSEVLALRDELDAAGVLAPSTQTEDVSEAARVSSDGIERDINRAGKRVYWVGEVIADIRDRFKRRPTPRTR